MVTFKIHYVTRWGENLLFERKSSRKGAPALTLEKLPMQYVADGHWSLALESASGEIEYRYVFQDDQGRFLSEPVFRRVATADGPQIVSDEWLPPQSADAAFLRQAFAGVIFNPVLEAGSLRPVTENKIRLTLHAPRVNKGCRVCVLGNQAGLGNWDASHPLPMSGGKYPLWEADIPRAHGSIEYKYGIWSDAENRLLCIEEGPNRSLDGLPSDTRYFSHNCASFRHGNPWKGAGVAIPVFSLRSQTGYGIGEFADLEPFALWASQCGMRLVQILPVNDTTSDYSWKDSYPYKAISTMALHPVYIHIQELFQQAGMALPSDFEARRSRLNALPQVDYEAVLQDKLAILRACYKKTRTKTLAGKAFKEFYRTNEHWLKPYAAFCHLRDRFKTPDFTQWGEFASFNAQKIEPWFERRNSEYDGVLFPCFIQFHLERQLNKALAAGRALGVAFKGDLPIGIDRCSVEAWMEPRLFHMGRQAGAPPDIFGPLGQNWGFPTYNWPVMAADGYAWWQNRLGKLSSCFDAIRIDHILGFFRIWEVPRQYTEGIMGHFNPAMPLSPQEIGQYGFHRDPALFAWPAVADWKLKELFGNDSDKVVSNLLFRDAEGWLRIRPAFEAADARAEWYQSACASDEAARIEDAMRRLSYEVLFLEDPDQPGRYHPRVTLQKTHIFYTMSEEEREVLSRLHDDFYYRRHTRFWEDEAMRKLPALMDASRMLICGEDLGMIPDCVTGVLEKLGILSLEIQRMPKRPDQLFAMPNEYPYMSVCSTSTHDMPVFRGWWAEELEGRQQFYNHVLGRQGQAPAECTVEISRFIVEQHLACPSMWCVLPLQDWLAMNPELRSPDPSGERINIPAIPRHYWRYRMHLTIDQLLGTADFNHKIKTGIQASGR